MVHGIVTPRPSSIMLIFIVVLHLESVLATCMEGDNQIQRYLISSEPPYDNYYNISKAVYPSVAPPSLLIDITVTFLAAADSNGTQNGAVPNNNASIAGMNSSKQNGSDSRVTGANTTYTYKWSKLCLYVSGGNISLSSMNIFSLWAIWPNRRKRELYITLPQFCSGSPSDPPRRDTMLYFLSTLQDIAVIPSMPDPRQNTIECVIAGHGKASHLPGLKKLLHGVCWSFLFISLVMGQFVSKHILVKLQSWDKDKIAGVMVLSLFIFFVGIGLNIYALITSTVKQDLYVRVFFLFVLFVFFRRCIYCAVIHCRNHTYKLHVYLTSGHDSDTSENIYSCVFLYPAVFMACHHVLWILLGIATEPLWGFTIFVVIASFFSVFYFLVWDIHKPSPPPASRCEKYFLYWMYLLLIPGGFLAFVLLLLVLLVVAQAFFGKDFISTIVQNGLVAIVAFGYREIVRGEGGEGGEGGGGGGGEGEEGEGEGEGGEGAGGEGGEGEGGGGGAGAVRGRGGDGGGGRGEGGRGDGEGGAGDRSSEEYQLLIRNGNNRQ